MFPVSFALLFTAILKVTTERYGAEISNSQQHTGSGTFSWYQFQKKHTEYNGF
jgi:hypothetical protein